MKKGFFGRRRSVDGFLKQRQGLLLALAVLVALPIGSHEAQSAILPKFSRGPAKWRKVGRSIKLSIPQVRNRSSFRTTGTLRVYLMAGRGRAVYRGGGRVVAFHQYLYVLPPNHFFRRQRVRVRIRQQPRGYVRTAMVLAEYNGANFIIRDVIRFPGFVRFRR